MKKYIHKPITYSDPFRNLSIGHASV